MKRRLATSRVLTYLWSFALIAFAIVAAPELALAQDTPPAEPTAAAAEAAPAEAAAAAETPAEAAPTLNSGDTAWMLTSTVLVLFMTIPGLALFYGGMVRSKNVLSVLMQCFAITGLMTVLWTVYGYSLAFDTAGMEAGVINLSSSSAAWTSSCFRDWRLIRSP